MSDTVDRDDLRLAARTALTRLSGPQIVRARIAPRLDEPSHPLDDSSWHNIAELGWTGIDVAEEFGGAGASFSDLAVVLQELGAFLAPATLVSTSVMAGTALAATAEHPRSIQLLRHITEASDRSAATIGVDDTAANASGAIKYLVAHGRTVLSGAVSHVLGAGQANTIVVAAQGNLGPALLALDRGCNGVTTTPVPMLDLTRDFDRVELDDVVIDTPDILAIGVRAQEVIDTVFDRTALALACDALGAATALLTRTVDYVSTRKQFGRAVGSFQAVKHQCSDMFLLVTTARTAVTDAALAVSEGAPDASLRVSRAKFYATDAASRVGDYAVRLRGGIGVTWEDDTHLYVKRIAVDQALAGTSRWHRRRVADLTFGSTDRGEAR